MTDNSQNDLIVHNVVNFKNMYSLNPLDEENLPGIYVLNTNEKAQIFDILRKKIIHQFPKYINLERANRLSGYIYEFPYMYIFQFDRTNCVWNPNIYQFNDRNLNCIKSLPDVKIIPGELFIIDNKFITYELYDRFNQGNENNSRHNKFIEDLINKISKINVDKILSSVDVYEHRTFKLLKSFPNTAIYKGLSENVPGIEINGHYLIVLVNSHSFIIYDTTSNKEIFTHPHIDPQRYYDITIKNKLIIINSRLINNDTQDTRTSHLYRIAIDEIPEDKMCTICFKKTDRNKILVPCGHTQYCTKCIEKLTECSICRSAITNIINIY